MKNANLFPFFFEKSFGNATSAAAKKSIRPGLRLAACADVFSGQDQMTTLYFFGRSRRSFEIPAISLTSPA